MRNICFWTVSKIQIDLRASQKYEIEVVNRKFLQIICQKQKTGYKKICMSIENEDSLRLHLQIDSNSKNNNN